MTLSELVTAARARLDDKVLPYAWSDVDLHLFINEAIIEACIRAKLYSLTNIINVKALKSLVSFESNYVRILRAEWVGFGEIEKIGHKILDHEYVNWQVRQATNPTKYLEDLDSNTNELRSLRLFPVPTVDGKLSILLQAVPEPLTSDGDEPPFNRMYHYQLLDWVCCLAYQTNDIDINNSQKSQEFDARFTLNFGEKPCNRTLEAERKGYGRRARARFV